MHRCTYNILIIFTPARINYIYIYIYIYIWIWWEFHLFTAFNNECLKNLHIASQCLIKWILHFIHLVLLTPPLSTLFSLSGTGHIISKQNTNFKLTLKFEINWIYKKLILYFWKYSIHVCFAWRIFMINNALTLENVQVKYILCIFSLLLFCMK